MPDIAGNAKYDAARSNWGGSWRLPTSDELDELISKCKREWTAMGGVNGYKVTGPNGKSIFLPASGCYKSNTLGFAGGCAVYWTSTPYEKGTQNAYGLIIVSDGFERSDVPRYCGVSVRPVSD
ncbi:MAG: hypothetical protein LUC86_03230 [Prevotellaceae bacterium]|nr:hypothetical protein [Prevotellaceae bacterium]